ncbi:MAG TPA: hypothetical protein VGL59_01150 [Polyangia bacterium]|jgi:hypothetical protein
MGQCRTATGSVILNLIFAAALLSRAASAAVTDLPVDQRLDAVRPALEAAVARAADAGVPVQPVIDKIREGLAKGVAAPAIRDATSREVAMLIDAQQFVAAHRPGVPAFPLVRAIALARERGVAPGDLQSLVESLEPAALATRAVEATTDLFTHEYPLRPAAASVLALAQREPAAIPRLLAGLEAIRAEKKSTAASALDALNRHGADNDSFETIVTRILQEPPPTAPPPRAKRRRHRAAD